MICVICVCLHDLCYMCLRKDRKKKQWPKEKGQTIIHEILHSKQNTEQHNLTKHRVLLMQYVRDMFDTTIRKQTHITQIM
jgi:hypothetical protein